MSIKSDIEEAKELWVDSSILFKLVIGLSLFFTVSAITSLADQIFAWKGFILDGVEFYRDYFSRPASELALALGFQYSSNLIDYLILISIIFLAGIRYIWVVESSDIKLNTITTILVALAFIYILYTASGLKSINTMQYLAPISVYIGFPYFSKMPKKLFWFAPIIIGTIIILILGAINSGLSR